MSVDPQQHRNRYYGRIALAFQGAWMVKLLDGRRCPVPAREVSESGIVAKPGDRVEVSIFIRPDGSISAFDPALVED